MKYFVKMEMALNNVKAYLKNKKGQGTIEYIMMVGVILVIAGLAIVAMRKIMPGLFDQMADKIKGAISNS